MSPLPTPHGGTLVNRMLEDPGLRKSLMASLSEYKSLHLNPRQLCDLELILVGGFSPLTGFMNQREYEGSLFENRLPSGEVWPMPITLDVEEGFARSLKTGETLALYDIEGFPVAILKLSDLWKPDRIIEAKTLFGTVDDTHPGVNYLLHHTHPYYVGGELTGLALPKHYDFPNLRQTPRDLRHKFSEMGLERIVGFQTRNPMHRAHVELTFQAAYSVEGSVLIHPVVGLTKPGDVDYFTRVRCYEKVLSYYPQRTAFLSLLPLAMRMAGPREALWHAIIRKNYGCSHFIIGRDHAGPGKDKSGKDFYGPYDAQHFVSNWEKELSIQILRFQELVYSEDRGKYIAVDKTNPGEKVLTISGTEFRQRLLDGAPIPEWFSYPEVIRELQVRIPPKFRQGFTVFFTGLSGAGKSTIARALMTRLLEIGGRSVTLLDGDHVRRILSTELGFSAEHRELNIRRIGYVAMEVTKAGGVGICSSIAPYASTRRHVRHLVTSVGGFIEVYVSTPLEVCESRDTKGLYTKARKGLIQNFTGINDPYEVPEYPEITINTVDHSHERACQIIVAYLEKEGYIR
ncbi:bifunctional sulfate adenylyltransferase/adenylylsulfate kinase [Leptospirillum ferriphilum]|uniref:Adenylyl-sulfate kinase n=1 Tax=Leptospirillum ferriphilum YSK TaxID=1441628 RepID=A0A059XUR9_9BACT|nr:bifunctional sulfate adenylyltransferase/adenylylsulfate kinase [Leptospirillum ferriphilum]AIA30795.1 adenylyltransferase [Leptospirillum ferriphilum YSK]